MGTVVTSTNWRFEVVCMVMTLNLNVNANVKLIFPQEFLDLAKTLTKFFTVVPKPPYILITSINEENVKMAQKTIDLEIKKVSAPLSVSGDVKSRRVSVTVDTGAFYRLNGNVGEAPKMSDGTPNVFTIGNVVDLLTISGEQDKGYAVSVVNIDDGGKESDATTGSFTFTDETAPQSSGAIGVTAVDEEGGVVVDDGT